MGEDAANDLARPDADRASEEVKEDGNGPGARVKETRGGWRGFEKEKKVDK